MKMRFNVLPVSFCVVAFSCISVLAQSPSPGQSNSTPQVREQSSTLPPNSSDPVANELELLRKSLQTLNARLRDFSDKYFAPDSKQGGASNSQQSRISYNLELLSKAEQRAETLRRQLLELTEKEMSYKSRLLQLDEDSRPESIERTMSLNGSTRAPELRDTRRRVLENDKKGFEYLLTQTSQSRARLDDDVRQADGLVSRLRQRVLPLIDKEVDKIGPN